MFGKIGMLLEIIYVTVVELTFVFDKIDRHLSQFMIFVKAQKNCVS